jgi:hypothetical protein
MKEDIEIKSIADPGDQSKEVVWLQANVNVDIGSYLITDSTFDSGGASNKWRHTFQFPRLVVKAGDWVGLWTKPGQQRIEERSSNQGSPFKVHHLFMNLRTSVWNATGDTARLFYQVQTQAVKKK